MEYDVDNEMFRLAIDLVNQSSRNIFLTGKAGTGKTTFLKYIKEHGNKQMAIVAPTGVAAINAGGVTIHSFFQLPLSPFIPESKGFSESGQEVNNKHSLVSRLRINNEKKRVLQELELLVIDEISMVRCDTIDAIDTVLRFIRQKPLDVFGGVQVLFIGDMYQLPPVIKDQEWKYLSEFYNSQYFFDSRSIQLQPPVYIEFSKIYRQSDERFIRLLNQVRNNNLDVEGREILESRFQPIVDSFRKEGYIILTTHNDKARSINSEALRNISGDVYSFRADIKDDFADNAHPADELLQLKIGAQVMFIKNDLDKSKRYYNGKIGRIVKLEDDKIFVESKDDGNEIEVKREKWDNIRYTLNKTSRQLEEEVLGSFTQYPLRLAWAITIHKSQGLTFEKAIIDAGQAFAPGQVYVALSRCTNLEGMILQSRVRTSNIFSDERIVQFSQSNSSAAHLQKELAVSRKNYQEAILVELFDFIALKNVVDEVIAYVTEHAASFNPEASAWLSVLQRAINKCQDTAMKFRPQLLNLISQDGLLEKNQDLQARIIAASKHFGVEILSLMQYLNRSIVSTDSTLHAKEYNEGLKELFAQAARKLSFIEALVNGFTMETYQHCKKNFVLPSITVNAYAGAATANVGSAHPILHQQLRKLRDAICARKNMPIYLVAGTKTIDEMATYLPQTPAQLEMISGLGPAKIEAYGAQFLEIIIDYAERFNLESQVHEKRSSPSRKAGLNKSKVKRFDTKAETFRLYMEGKMPSEISELRKLTTATIEGHLAYYVEQGVIEVNKLVTAAKIEIIDPVIHELHGEPLQLIKQRLGDAVSFGEIRMVIAGKKYNDTVTASNLARPNG